MAHTAQKTCIVTGGAGFIGCALSTQLVRRFDRVIAMDVLHPQIHAEKKRPALLDAAVELVTADVCDAQAWDELLQSVGAVDTVVHLAAETGTSQSMTDTTRHAHTNVVGTAAMLDAFERCGRYPRQILLTGSRAVYGEGAWQRASGEVFYPGQRSDAQLAAGQWDFEKAQVLPFSAQKTWPHPTSIYGATKLAQEQMIASWCMARGVAYKIVRLQNVYGPGQSLINPYTGIVSLFVRLSRQGRAIELYEDGEIIRDFILIDDVARAIVLALESESAAGQTLDIGTGTRTTIAQIARLIAQRYGAPEPQVCGKYRNGDIRHAVCDPMPAKEIIGFEAAYDVEQGVARLCEWIDAQYAAGLVKE